jgi:PhnB protein
MSECDSKPTEVQEVQHPGYRTLTTYFVVKGLAEAIEFYKKAFGAVELLGMPDADGNPEYAEILIRDSILMLNEESLANGFAGPDKSAKTVNHMGTLYVEDVDALYQQAVAAGATVVHEMQTHDCGARYGIITDPFGHTWTIAVAA